MSSATEHQPRSWVPIAKLLRPQGRRGELLADPLTDLTDLFSPGLELTLAASDGSEIALIPAADATRVTLESHFFPTGKNSGRIVLKLSGCETISAAEALAGQQLLVPREALPALAPDTFFVRDLVGCALYDAASLHPELAVGTIVDVEFAYSPDGRTRLPDAAPLLAVQLVTELAAEPVLVPFIRAWLDTIDLPARRIVMHLPKGLLNESHRIS